jgi:1,4-alpha-glucan branching enzyme
MGAFAKDMFGPNTDWNRAFVRDFFFTVNVMWLEWFHLDGFRYDCVPNYWSADPREGYGSLVWATYQHVKSQNGAGAWARFSGPAGRLHLIQIAEQLEAPHAVVKDTYSTSTWQNETYEAAKVVAFGHDGAITRLGRALGLDGYPTVATYNGVDTIDKVPLQYIENHDHERFITHFGRTGAPDDLFSEGNRDAWWKLQPYLIALLLAKGAPLLWEGQELCESYWIPGSGRARVGILRPVRWNFFYDEAGRGIVTLVRKLLALRKARPELRGGDFYFYDERDRYQNRGVLMYSRWSGSSFTLVGVNFTASDVTVPFWFPGSGPYTERLHGTDSVPAAAPLTERALTIPSNYGQVWST